MSDFNTLNLIKVVDLGAHCFSVTIHEGKIYAGCYGNVYIVDEHYTINKWKVQLGIGDAVNSIVFDQDRAHTLIYAFKHNKTFKVFIPPSEDKQETKEWVHYDSCTFSNQLAAVSQQLVIPSRSHKTLVSYSREGKVLRHIPLEISFNQTAICAVGSDSVIVTDYHSSQVYRVNVSTSKIEWVSKEVTSPQGVATYREEYVLVWSFGRRTVCLLHAASGKLDVGL